MKKFFLSLCVIITFTAYALHQKLEGFEEIVTTTTSVTTPFPVRISSSGTPSLQPTSTLTPVPARAGFKDGTYTGTAADAYYGNVQVQIVIRLGKITDVLFLDYPKDRRTSIAINTQAMPYLKSEAIQAQNASVDIVSGATQTSRAFRESLRSALVQAK